MKDSQLARAQEIKKELAFLEEVVKEWPKNANSYFALIVYNEGSKEKELGFSTFSKFYKENFKQFLNGMIIALNKEFNEL